MDFDKILDLLPVILVLYGILRGSTEKKDKKLKEREVLDKKSIEDISNKKPGILMEIKRSIAEGIEEAEREIKLEKSLVFEDDSNFRDGEDFSFSDLKNIFDSLADKEDRVENKKHNKTKKSYIEDENKIIGPKYKTRNLAYLENNLNYKEKDKNLYENKINSKLKKQDLLKGFIFSEVLSEPKCKK